MPIGPYKDFNECVRAQMMKGNSRASAERICGKLESMARKKHNDRE